MIWLIYNFFIQLGLLATGTFVDLYLWTETGSLTTILRYNLGVFITLPILSFVIAWIIETTGLKISQILSLLFAISFTIILMFTKDLIVAQPIFLGLIKGVSLGALLLSTDVLGGKIASEGVEKTISQLAATKTISNIFLPPLIAFSLFYFSVSYNLVFGIGLLAFLVALLASLFITFPTTDFKLNLSVALLPTNSTNPEKFLLARSHFLIGIKEGFFFSLLGVIALHFTGDLQGWAIFTFFLGIASFLFELLYTKFFKTSQSLVVSGAGAIIFTFFAVIFVANFNLMGLVFFALGNTFLSATFGISLSSSLGQIANLDATKEDLNTEYALFSQIYKNFGRFIPIVVLLFLDASITDPGILEGVIVAVSLVPFSIIGVVSKSFALRHAAALQSQIT